MYLVLAGEVLTTEPPEKPSTSSLVQIFSCYQSPAMQEAQVQFLGREDSLEKGMATGSVFLSLRILWMNEPGRLQSMGSQRVRHDGSDLAAAAAYTNIHFLFINFYWHTLAFQYCVSFCFTAK